MPVNKRKIINDPLYGFISITSDLIFDIIETPVFQRLRRINQMGLADFVYPGALHTRFHHALGAMHLMGRTLDNLRDKGHSISAEEYEAALLAILLHDIGHGPFSHSLEQILLPGTSHEELSVLLMQQLNEQFDGALDMTLQMFTGQYQRPFFHQLIASQLDVDRLDYLNRDSFFTGVSEGTIGAERIIKLLDLADDHLVVEEKGVYSVEHFLNARRLMYWQVYLHKTGLAADIMLAAIMQRARKLLAAGSLTEPEHLLYFLVAERSGSSPDNEWLARFSQLDDHDIWAALKQWQHHEDRILAYLCRSFLHRRLFKISLTNQPDEQAYNHHKQRLLTEGVSNEELPYLLHTGEISNAAYIHTSKTIKMLRKNGEVVNIDEATDLPNIKAMSRIVRKHYLCWAKHIDFT